MSKLILVDMNTQRDFLDSHGAMPVQNARELIKPLKQVFALARSYHVPVISALDSHRDGELNGSHTPHCIEGSAGQAKLRYTLLSNRIMVEANNSLDLPQDLLKSYRQVILRRRTQDLLDNPKADRLFTHLPVERFIMFGVGLERSIRRLALALLARGRQVSFIPTACGYFSETDADLTVRLLLAKGAETLELTDLEDRFKHATRRRVKRVYSKAPESSAPRRTLTG